MKQKIIDSINEDSVALETILTSNNEKLILLNAQTLEVKYKLEQNRDIVKFIESLDDEEPKEPLKNPQPKEGRVITKRRL